MSSSPAPAPDAPLPVGFRFRPTDEELVRHYLKPKIAGRAHPDLLLIPDIDLSACEPWELPARSLIRSGDPEWFFFAPLGRKYPGSGHRSNRSTAAGYWKATGKDRLIRSPAGALIGVKKTLVFHRGRAPRGRRTAWIMHEYRAAEPHLLQHGQNGSFVLYRLFDKHEEEEEDKASPAPATPPGTHSNSPNSEDTASPSASSPANPQHATPMRKAPVSTEMAPILKDENLQASSTEMAHLLTTVTSNAPQDAQAEDSLLDVLAQLPDLQADQRFDGFPRVTSPMRPYTDHPFVGNIGGPDLSAYITNFISHQDLQDFLLTSAGNAEPSPTALPMPSNSSNNKILPETTCAKSDSDNTFLIQGAGGAGAACFSSPTKILQMDTSYANHEAGTSLAYSAPALVSHLYNQYQLQSTFSPEMEPPNSGALCSADSLTPYPQQLFNNMVPPSTGDLTYSDAFNIGLQGWAAEPTMQQFTVSNLMDPQQGTAARRIRLVHSVQRASVTDPVLTSHLENEGETGSDYSTISSSTDHNQDYTNITSETTAGEAMHTQGGVLIPTQVISSVEVTGKLRDFSFDEDISRHGKLSHEANLKKRLKREYTETSQNVRIGPQHSNRVPEEPSLRRRRQPAPIGLVVQLLCLGLVMILVFVGLWKSSLCKSLH